MVNMSSGEDLQGIQRVQAEHNCRNAGRRVGTALGMAAALLLSAPALAGAPKSSQPAANPYVKPPPKKTRIAPAPAPAWNVAGHWTWKAKCSTGVWHGGWNIVPSSPYRFTGTYTGTNIADVGIIVNGRVKGRTMTLLHKFTDIFGKPHDDRVAGTLYRTAGGLKVTGTSGDETFSCTFTASK